MLSDSSSLTHGTNDTFSLKVFLQPYLNIARARWGVALPEQFEPATPVIAAAFCSIKPAPSHRWQAALMTSEYQLRAWRFQSSDQVRHNDRY